MKSGAEVTTLELLRCLPPELAPVLACPEGRLAHDARAAGVTVVPIRGMTGSLRLHPTETPRGVRELGRMARTVRALARTTRADLVHATSIRAGLAACLPAGPLPPVVVSLHDCLPPGALSTGTRRIVDAGAALVIANSRHTAAAWRPPGADGPRVEVVHPGIDLSRHDRPLERGAARAALGLPPAAPVLGVVAQITPWKGQDTAIRALALVRDALPDAQLALIGETKFVARATRHDNRAYLASLHALAAELGLDGAVRFLGQRHDTAALMPAFDLLLVPSTEEPFGLVVVEAMAAGTAVVATSSGGPAEIIADGVDGRLAPPGRPDAWARIALELLTDPATRDRLVVAGRRTAQRFSAERYAARVAALYRAARAG